MISLTDVGPVFADDVAATLDRRIIPSRAVSGVFDLAFLAAIALMMAGVTTIL